eukprot:14538369-Heterocapsa_arctica.AAC.1
MGLLATIAIPPISVVRMPLAPNISRLPLPNYVHQPFAPRTAPNLLRSRVRSRTSCMHMMSPPNSAASSTFRWSVPTLIEEMQNIPWDASSPP